ncbi:MAG: hypothetical protein DRJ98_04155 [Thermoprotei archaeon]|nr:MAG: hypothetical protein DRJ98_04155 [Thermoprotei archaeon]RLF17351.1 MAG: hypothetical protein DRN06_03975 [Thermoprotei archaeon]
MPALTAYKVRLELEGLGDAEAELIRIYAPRTVEALAKSMPVRSRVYPGQGYVYFQVPLSMGVEKPRREMEEGSLAYWPQAKAVCVFYKKMKFNYDLSLLGKITGNLELLVKVKAGTPILAEVVASL